MTTRRTVGRLLAGLTSILLLTGCSAGAGPTTVPATVTPVATPSVALATPTRTPTPSPTVAPSAVYDASTAVRIHLEAPECVTAAPGTTDDANGVRQMRGWTRHCRYDAADPRFSGWSEIVLNSDCYPADTNCVRWGTERIPGPNGDWIGTFQGVGYAEAVRANLEILEGTGAYEGWTVVWYMDMAAEEWVIDGLIYHGPPPPVPPLPSPASD